MAARAPEAIAFAVRGPIARADLPGLCDRLCRLLERSRAPVVLCDVRGVEPDAVTVDALARLQLAARRHGSRVLLRHASEALLELVAFMGLEDVLSDESYASSRGGNPNSGNSASVSRKNVNSASPSGPGSTTWSAQGS